MGEGNEQKVSGKKIRSHGAGLAMRVSCVSIAINVVLSVFKVGAGILAHSGAMISDGVHSASDVFSTLIVMAGITMASRKSRQFDLGVQRSRFLYYHGWKPCLPYRYKRQKNPVPRNYEP